MLGAVTNQLVVVTAVELAYPVLSQPPSVK